MGVFWDSLADTVDSTLKPAKAYMTCKKTGPPPPPPNAAWAVQQAVGAAMGAVNMPVQLMNTGFAVATDAISQALPSFPAATMCSLYISKGPQSKKQEAEKELAAL